MKNFSKFLAVALIGVSTSAMARDDMKMNMKMMDANGDGMISKDEFMKYHEMMYDKMKKNSAGMIDVKEMETMHHDMDMKQKGKAKGKDDMTKKEGVAK